MNEALFVELIVGLMVVGIGWLHMRQSALEVSLKEKADKDDFDELKADVKKVSEHIVDLKVDQTRCLTILEGLAKNSSKNT